MLTQREIDYINNLPKEIAEKPVRILSWDKRGFDIARAVVNNIKATEPTLKVFLRGSLPLKIAGLNDADITCPVSADLFEVYRKKFRKLLGNPSTVNDSSMVWHFVRDGYEIGVYLVDSAKSDQLQRQNNIHKLLKDNLNLLKEYEQLKISCDGVAYKDYLGRKFEFLNKIRSSCVIGSGIIRDRGASNRRACREPKNPLQSSL